MKKFSRTKGVCLLFAVVCGCVLFVGCNRPTTSPQAGAPAGLTPETEVTLKAVFPHSSDFKSKTHGKYFEKNKMLCAKCHGQDFNGGTAQVSCNSCHVNFPHPMNWGSPKNHGVTFAKLNDDQRAKCMTCHSSEKPGVGVSCQQCHLAYPHSDTFVAGGHSELYHSGQGKCLTCHESVKANVPEMADRVSCQTCHMANFPHPARWALPTNHGAYYETLSANDKKQCFQCHTADKPSSGVSCQQCHKAFPHSKEFFDNGHGSVANSYEGKCLLCHVDYKKNIASKDNPQGCQGCHAGKINTTWKEDKQADAAHKSLIKSRKPSSQPHKPSSN